MKLKGQKITPPKPHMVVLPRGDKPEDSLIFMCDAVLSYDEFDRLCPMPVPPKKVFAGGKMIDDMENPKFTSALEKHFDLRYKWMVITSLRATPDLEWETVDFQNPDSWNNYEKELSVVMTKAEINEIQLGVMNANSMNQERMKQAREFFQNTPEVKA